MRSQLKAGCATILALAMLAPGAVHALQAAPATEVVVHGKARPKPVTTPPPLEIFARPAKYEHVALSPDGDVFAFVTTVDGEHILATYRFSDKSKRAVKLTSGGISALTFADDDHILVTTSRTGPRGTCGSAGDGTGQTLTSTLVREPAQGMGRSNLLSMSDPRGAAEASITAALLDGLKIPNCVYYGVRSQDSVTSVDMTAQKGFNLGDHLSEYANLPLGTPQPVSDGAKSRLAGPFLELRSQTVNRQPTERVYWWSLDPATGIGRMVDDGGGDLDRETRYADDWVTTPQGAFVARATYNLFSTEFSIEMKPQGHWKPVLTRKIVAKDHTFAPLLAGLSADGEGVVIVDAAPDGKAYHYYQLSSDGKLSGPLEPDDAATDRPLFDPASGRLLGFAGPGANDTYSLTDPALQSLYDKALEAVPGEAVHVAAVAHDPHRMVIYAAGGEDPGGYYLVDFTTGHSEPLGEDYAEVPSEWVADQDWLDYQAADGLQLHALVTFPTARDSRNLPVVVLPHDGPRAHDAAGFNWLAQALASRGYLVVQPNYRGSDGYGEALIDAGEGQLGRKMQSDIDDAVRAIVAKGWADPHRVCIAGIGMGGYAALNGAAHADLYRCAISINGIADLDRQAAWLDSHQVLPTQDAMTTLAPDPQWPRAFMANPGSVRRLTAYAGGDLKTISPVSHAADVNVPVLLIHDSGDTRVSAWQSQTMREALDKTHKTVELVTVPGQDHDMATQDARLKALTAVTGFLAKYNPAN